MLSIAFCFFEDWGGKPEWYNEVKEKNDSWERAWKGSFFPIKCDCIWITFKGKNVSIAILHHDTGVWQSAVEVMDLNLKSNGSDSFLKRLF